MRELEAAFAAANRKGKLDAFFTPETLQNVREGLAFWRKEHPDIQWQLNNVVRKGNRVAFRYTASATPSGSREKMSWQGTAVGMIVDGKVHIAQVNEDVLGATVGRGQLPESPQDDISGTWDGDLFGVDFKLNLQQPTGKDTVRGKITALGNTIPVSGTNVPPNVTISGSSPKGQISLAGKWTGPNQISGTLSGAGFRNQPIEIGRQK